MATQQRKFGRESAQRKALLKALATNLIVNGKIKTTEAKAKSLRPEFEKLVTRAKKNTIHSKRLLNGFLSSEAAKKLISEIAPKYVSRPGGYTRIIKAGPRKSDGARMAYIEIV